MLLLVNATSGAADGFVVLQLLWWCCADCVTSPRTGCARRTKLYMCGTSKQQYRSCVSICLIVACSRHAYIFLFFVHIPFVVRSHNERNTTREVATLQSHQQHHAAPEVALTIRSMLSKRKFRHLPLFKIVHFT